MSKLVPIAISPAPVSSPKPGRSRTIVDLASALPPIAAKEGDKDSATRLRELEVRLGILESAVIDHALILRDRICIRLDRLEQKFQYEADGLRRALQNEVSDRRNNIIQLTQSITTAVDRVESNQPAADVQGTMRELTQVLADARTHLAGLTQAVRGRHEPDGLAS